MYALHQTLIGAICAVFILATASPAHAQTSEDDIFLLSTSVFGLQIGLWVTAITLPISTTGGLIFTVIKAEKSTAQLHRYMQDNRVALLEATSLGGGAAARI